MNPKIIVLPTADRDIDSQFDYYAVQASLDVALRFIDSAHRTIDRIAEMPEKARIREFHHSRLFGIRAWPVDGFPMHRIFYRVDNDAVRIVRVLHGARDIDNIL